MNRNELNNQELDMVNSLCIIAVIIITGGFASAVFAGEKKVNDEDITNHIEIEFQIDGSVPSNSIDVVTKAGIVTLSGNVDNILAKDRAQNIAEATVGVRTVINRIKVVPPKNLSDEQVKESVRRALSNDPATDSYLIKVDVNNGIVRLTGTVGSWQEKQLCTMVTKGVIGVTGVINDISIVYKVSRSDSEIKQDVVARLARDARVDDALIGVSVKDQKVSLSGVVGSLQEKNRAISDAWVNGVVSVDANALDVKWGARDQIRKENPNLSKTEEELEEDIKDAFLYDPRVYSFEIDINVNGNTVILNGIVDNLKAKKAAEEDTRNTAGVERIINNIKVRPEMNPSNAELERMVNEAFVNDPYIGRFNLNITTYNGTVYLFGEVTTSWEKNRAGKIAEGIKGVVTVINNIDYKYKWIRKEDWQIKADVEEHLFWSAFVDGDKINVTVDNGVVTLTGTVETYSERQNAEINAYQGGARYVINNLAVNRKSYGPSEYNYENLYSNSYP